MEQVFTRLLRARLTESEWLELRYRALQQKLAVQEIITKLIREYLSEQEVAHDDG